jgi:hypothetical protein
VRGLFERGFDAKTVRELFRIIDWLMELPPQLDTVFWQDVGKINEEQRMPYIPLGERVGRYKGLCQGIEALLRVRFGEAAFR